MCFQIFKHSLSGTTPIFKLLVLQWNLSITDTIGDPHFVHYSGVSLTQGLPVYFGRRGLRIWAVEYNVCLRFQSYTSLYVGREG